MQSLHTLLPLLLLLLCIAHTASLQIGERISGTIQVLHNGWKSQITDLSLHQMPRFRSLDTSIVHTNIPGPDHNRHITVLNPNEDFKILLTFSNSYISTQWIPLFDAKNRRSIVQLVVTFDHDEYNLYKGIKYDIKYSPTIQRLDPSHPSLHTFEIVYKWNQLADEDTRLGILVLFILTVISIGSIAYAAVIAYQHRLDTITGRSSAGRVKVTNSVGYTTKSIRHR